MLSECLPISSMASQYMVFSSASTALVRSSSAEVSRKWPITRSMCLCRILPTRFLHTSSFLTLPAGISIFSKSLAYLLARSSLLLATEIALRVASLNYCLFRLMKEKSFCVKQASISLPVIGERMAE